MDRAAARSLALHRAVAARLRADPGLLVRARARVRAWLEDESVHPFYANAWSAVLAQPLELVCAAISEPGERMIALRQASPFAGALDPGERWRILREAYAS